MLEKMESLFFKLVQVITQPLMAQAVCMNLQSKMART
jgi:hypothetical protein